jgi:hypothetical protein
MKHLKLNKDFGKVVQAHGYELNSTEQYYICLDDEIEQQSGILGAVQTMGLPAINDYHKWLKDNGFSADMPNPTNDLVSSYFGVRPLWSTKLSQGIVVKNEGDDDYYIIMECSRENTGFKYTHLVLTMGGCM